MRMFPKSKVLLAGLVSMGSAIPVWAAQPTVSDMLRFKPKQRDIVYTIPTAQEQEQCKVELVRQGRKGSGWVLKMAGRDGKEQLLRRFYDSKGAGYPDQMCYYKDGNEVYREVDTNGNKVTDQFRWLNSGGMKIGIDKNEDGAIDAWQAISVEELSQEVLRAVVAKDYKKLEVLLVTEQDLRSIDSPANEISRIRDLQRLAPGKFRQTVNKLSHLNETTQWLRLETSPPSRLPAESTGMKQDILMYYRGIILCATGEKHDWLQVGEIVQIGDAWKLIDSPLPGGTETVAPEAAGTEVSKRDGATTDPALQPILSQIAQLDQAAPQPQGHGPDAALVRYQVQRSDLLEQVIAKAKESDKEIWLRQLADSLSAAVQSSSPGETKIIARLHKLADQMTRDQPGTDIAAYVAFRAMSAEHLLKLSGVSKPEDALPIQTKFQDNLARFVKAYPKAEDTPDALLQLGMNSEFQNKESNAKKWYEQLVELAGSSPQGVKAKGALRRLNIEGMKWDLPAPVASLTGGQFGMDRVQGKIVVVYHWATMCPTAVADFTKLKELAKTYRTQMEIVAINVDDNQADAEGFVRRHSPVGHQLYGGGLEGVVATHYGMVVFPNLFLVGEDGKVVSRTVLIGNLEDELKKLLNK